MPESRTQRARRLGRISLEVLREDRRLWVFPAVSAVVSLGLGGISFGLAAGLLGGGQHARRVLVLGGIIASYPVTFVALFSGVALACMLTKKLNGEPVSARDGWRAARDRAGLIAAWTLVVCTVGAVLRLLEEYLPLGGKVAAWVLDISWSLATLFAVPVLAYEGLGPRATLRRSAELFRARWGEQIAGVVAIGLFTWLLAIPICVLIAAAATANGAGAVILIAVGGSALLGVQALSIALNQVYRIFLYRDTVGAPGGGGPFPKADLDQPFHPRKGWLR